MGSVSEMQSLLKHKDARIKELETLLQQKEDMIVEMRSQLDKYQSVLPRTLTVGPRKQRAQGISAEPQALKSLQNGLRKHSKSNSDMPSNLITL
ncbi:hypothetical protein CHS0354_007510 [Potamilus streckersoni]|uniref:cGMP-dependent protein kinase N-terminal coiled-coil domain-containing protein n=1 Tax=Potamilus streckersoni TaxID=2493646 RepID=A0AAE0W7Y3_9BIVA|nr:hypothetical protein CHS0354_007510 [Potamilus streckersoni]